MQRRSRLDHFSLHSHGLRLHTYPHLDRHHFILKRSPDHRKRQFLPLIEPELSDGG